MLPQPRAFDDFLRRLVERRRQRLQEIHPPLEQRQRRLAAPSGARAPGSRASSAISRSISVPAVFLLMT